MAKKDNRTVAERLYDERVHLAAKQQMRVKMQEREAEKAFEDAHTFKPEVGVVVGEGSARKKVIRKRDGTPVQSRFRQVRKRFSHLADIYNHSNARSLNNRLRPHLANARPIRRTNSALSHPR